VSGSPDRCNRGGGGDWFTGDGKRYSAIRWASRHRHRTYNSKNVGTANTVTFGGVSLNGAQSGDYSLTIQSPASATITGALLTITASSQTKTYGQTVTFGSGSTLFTSTHCRTRNDWNGDPDRHWQWRSRLRAVSGSPYTITPSAATGGRSWRTIIRSPTTPAC